MPASRIAVPIEEVLGDLPASPPAGRILGRSREGRTVEGFLFGSGPSRVSLIGGCHADEPVGPAMLRRLAAFLAELAPGHPLLQAATFYLVPHVNPDGEAVNSAWSEATVPAADHLGTPDRAYDLAPYLRHVDREWPGDDLEFGFPRSPDDLEARPEARAVAAFLSAGAPFALHGSFHGMGFAPGPWFLIERAWIDRTAPLREALRRRVREMGYGLFDIDRGGEKGFSRIDEGFTTRPDSRAMTAHFLERDDTATAALFRPSSMEYVRSLGGDPFTLVSEMPLFLRPQGFGEEQGTDERGFRGWLSSLLTGRTDAELGAAAAARGVTGMPIRDQMRLQLEFLNQGLAAVADAAG
jgi:hypothetical protein